MNLRLAHLTNPIMKTTLALFVAAFALANTTPVAAGPDTSAAFAQRAAKEYAAKEQDSAARIALVHGNNTKAPKANTCKDGSCCSKR